MEALYVHVPFCVKKCLYCDFNSYADISLESQYIDAMVKEIGTIKEKSLKTIFIGGGTPTILSYKNLETLLEALEEFKAQEFSIESNPGTIDKEKLDLLRTHGVNRLSIGLQAWQNSLLKTLGRIHTLDDFLKSYNAARDAGFENINIDLMFDIPGQTTEDWKETIDNVAALKPEHISCYSLIVEEGTPFHSMWEKGMLVLPDEDEDRQMYCYAVEKLKSYGYKQYEISNFSKPGFECRHNIVYWKDREYAGVGAGAHGYVDGFRYSNLRGVGEYIKGIRSGSAIEEKAPVTINDSMEEFMFLGLRMIEGISKEDFKKRFNTPFEEVYGMQLKKFTSLKLLYDDGEMVKLTPRGIDISNQVFEEFML
jgi:oxygen-independent coproporphyrinogen-3 oxidase